jgi:hypothetical protein
VLGEVEGVREWESERWVRGGELLATAPFRSQGWDRAPQNGTFSRVPRLATRSLEGCEVQWVWDAPMTGSESEDLSPCQTAVCWARETSLRCEGCRARLGLDMMRIVSEIAEICV